MRQPALSRTRCWPNLSPAMVRLRMGRSAIREMINPVAHGGETVSRTEAVTLRHQGNPQSNRSGYAARRMFFGGPKCERRAVSHSVAISILYRPWGLGCAWRSAGRR